MHSIYRSLYVHVGPAKKEWNWDTRKGDVHKNPKYLKSPDPLSHALTILLPLLLRTKFMTTIRDVIED